MVTRSKAGGGSLPPSLGPSSWLWSTLGDPAMSWVDRVQPVPLHRARVIFASKRTHAYLPEKDRIYREELQVLWRGARLRPIEEDQLAVSMVFRGRGRIRPDVTNLAKAVEDAGNGFLWGDDGQIEVLVLNIADWGSKADPMLRIDVWRLGQ